MKKNAKKNLKFILFEYLRDNVGCVGGTAERGGLFPLNEPGNRPTPLAAVYAGYCHRYAYSISRLSINAIFFITLKID